MADLMEELLVLLCVFAVSAAWIALLIDRGLEPERRLLGGSALPPARH